MAVVGLVFEKCGIANLDVGFSGVEGKGFGEEGKVIGVYVVETFKPVVKSGTIRTVLSLAISWHWPVHQLDVKNAFLHGDLSETVYMHQPPRFRDSTHFDYVCLLQQSLYGLKQALRAWFQRFAVYITRVGFSHSRYDSSLFIYRQRTDTTYLLLCLNDIVLTTSSKNLLQRIIASLHHEFSMTGLVLLIIFWVFMLHVTLQGCFYLNVSMLLRSLSGLSSRNPVDTESRLSNDGDSISDPTLYRSLAGSLQYLTFTRPDIFYVAHAEAEYRGVANAVVETYWLRNLLCELHTHLSSATLVYCDNVSVVYLSSNPFQRQLPKLQTTEDLQGDALLHYDAEMKLMNLILLSIPNEIYNSMDACTTAKEMWKRVEHLMRQFEKLVNASRAKKLEKSHDPLALVAHTGS
ncbi:ribonuclease H-like domain-containing protein, partial [Tanacetum coccineum]